MKLSKTLAMMKRLWWLLLCALLGFVGASLYQAIHGPSVEANTTLAATAADSGSGAPIIDGVGWVSDHSTTFSSTPTGHCEVICLVPRCNVAELDGYCGGLVRGACRDRYDPGQCPVHAPAGRLRFDRCDLVDTTRFCTP